MKDNNHNALQNLNVLVICFFIFSLFGWVTSKGNALELFGNLVALAFLLLLILGIADFFITRHDKNITTLYYLGVTCLGIIGLYVFVLVLFFSSFIHN